MLFRGRTSTGVSWPTRPGAPAVLLELPLPERVFVPSFVMYISLLPQKLLIAELYREVVVRDRMPAVQHQLLLAMKPHKQATHANSGLYRYPCP